MVTGLRWGGFASFGDYLSQKNEPSAAVREYLRAVLREGAVVLDIGANLGSFSLYVCSCGIEIRSVFAFEPVPRTFKGLQANVSRHELPIRTKRLAFGATESDEVLIEVHADSPATAAVSSPTSRGAATVAAPMTTLDRFVEAHEISCIDLAKLDVEGFEIEVLHGAQGIIRDGRLKTICLEICPGNLNRYGRQPEDLYDELHNADFSILYCGDDNCGRLNVIPKDEFCSLRLADVLCVHRSVCPPPVERTNGYGSK